MGLTCSKNFNDDKVNAVATPYEADGGIQCVDVQTTRQTDLSVQLLHGSVEKQVEDLKEPFSNGLSCNNRRGSHLDDFYDGIPLVPTALSRKSRSMRSTQAAVAKVSEVSSRLGRAGTMGFEKAVEVLDVLGSSMTDLNSRSGFASAIVSKGNKISILAFEVANTIMKGACLMHSLSESSIHHLKEGVLHSEAVQKLVLKDTDELLKMIASDKREELALFSREVIRFGNRCKDPQWHNLDRYFMKQSGQVSPHKQLKEDAETVMQQLIILVQYTAELYHELQTLHRFDQDSHSKYRIEAGSHAILPEEFKKQKKLVKKLKKRSLWSRSLEEIMEKLLDVVLFLHMEIQHSFGTDGQFEDAIEAVEGPLSSYQRLGPAGLSLHYANIILQIDGIAARSSSMPPNARESLYQSLPPSIKSSLRSKIQSFHVKEEFSPPEIKAEMEKTLQWLVPIASNTIKSHHGFGWVGEWANSGFEASEPSTEKAELIRIETLYHADKVKTEAYITDQLVWLHHLISRSRMATIGFGIKMPLQRKQQYPEPKVFNHSILNDFGTKKWSPGASKSEDFDAIKDTTAKHDRLCKSSSHSPTRENKDLLPVIPLLPSGGGFVSLGMKQQQQEVG